MIVTESEAKQLLKDAGLPMVTPKVGENITWQLDPKHYRYILERDINTRLHFGWQR